MAWQSFTTKYCRYLENKSELIDYVRELNTQGFTGNPHTTKIGTTTNFCADVSLVDKGTLFSTVKFMAVVKVRHRPHMTVIPKEGVMVPQKVLIHIFFNQESLTDFIKTYELGKSERYNDARTLARIYDSDETEIKYTFNIELSREGCT